jgi:hypothetical protein
MKLLTLLLVLPLSTPPSDINLDGERHAIATAPAVRLNPPEPPTPVGIWGQPFAPEGLSDCDEMNFYRLQWGLPDQFSDQPRSGSRSSWGYGWRESNCRNEEDVRTYCCYGYWQLYFSQHMKDHRMGPRYAACGINEISDYNGDEPLDKQKQACAAAALYEVDGLSPWKL